MLRQSATLGHWDALSFGGLLLDRQRRDGTGASIHRLAWAGVPPANRELEALLQCLPCDAIQTEAGSSAGDQSPIARGNAVPAPFVDGFTINGRAFSFQGCRHGRAATKRGYDLIMREHASIVRNCFGLVNGNSSDNVPSPIRDDSVPLMDPDPMSNKPEKAYALAAGRRLRATREALGFSSGREFAQITNVSEDVLSAWERGKALVRPWYISVLKERWGVTQDWIYDGEMRGLEFSLGTALKERDAQSSLSGSDTELSEQPIAQLRNLKS